MQVWVLDALPGEVRAGDSQRKDHPADLIACLQRLPMPIPNRTLLQNYLSDHGFSNHIAKWTSTNLKPVNGDARFGILLLSPLHQKLCISISGGCQQEWAVGFGPPEITLSSFCVVTA